MFSGDWILILILIQNVSLHISKMNIIFAFFKINILDVTNFRYCTGVLSLHQNINTHDLEGNAAKVFA